MPPGQVRRFRGEAGSVAAEAALLGGAPGVIAGAAAASALYAHRKGWATVIPDPAHDADRSPRIS